MNIQTNQQSHRILVALALCMALQMTGFTMILPLFARRFESLVSGVEALGMSAMAFALTSTIASPFIGILADRIGRRPIILVSLACYVMAFSGYLLATSAWLLIFLRGLAGFFTAGLVPAVTSSVGDIVSENRRAQWIGIVNGGASVGWIIGPVLGGILFDRSGYVMPFTAAIILALTTLLVAVFLIPETYRGSAQTNRPRLTWTKAFRALPAPPTFFLIMLISFGVMFAWAFIEPQFMFYAYDQLSWTSSQLGMVISMFGLTCTFGEFFLGRLSDRFGRKPVLVLGLALFSAQFAGLVIFVDARWIMVSFILAGLGNALYDPALNALLLDITPSKHTARVMGLKGTVGSLGNMLGPALVTLFVPFVSPQVVFLISAALVFVLTFTSGLALRVPQITAAHQYSSTTGVTRSGD